MYSPYYKEWKESDGKGCPVAGKCPHFKKKEDGVDKPVGECPFKNGKNTAKVEGECGCKNDCACKSEGKCTCGDEKAGGCKCGKGAEPKVVGECPYKNAKKDAGEPKGECPFKASKKVKEDEKVEEKIHDEL